MSVPLSILDLSPISEGATPQRRCATPSTSPSTPSNGDTSATGSPSITSSPSPARARGADRPDRRRHQHGFASAPPRCNSGRPRRSRSSRASACSTRSIPAASTSASDGPASAAARRSRKRPVDRNPRRPTEWRDVDGVVVPPPFDISALMRNPRLRARMSVLQQPEAVAPDFGDQVDDILAMLDGRYQIDGVDAHPTPGERRR